MLEPPGTMRTPLSAVESLHRVGGLVEPRLPRGVDRHVDDRAQAEAEQDALLHPAVDAPAGLRAGVGLGRADCAAVQARFEFVKEAEVLFGVLRRLVVEDFFDSLTKHSRVPGRPAPDGIFASVAGCGAHIGSRHTGSQRPIIAIAAFTGNRDSIRRRSRPSAFASRARDREVVGLGEPAHLLRERRSRPPR